MLQISDKATRPPRTSAPQPADQNLYPNFGQCLAVRRGESEECYKFRTRPRDRPGRARHSPLTRICTQTLVSAAHPSTWIDSFRVENKKRTYQNWSLLRRTWPGPRPISYCPSSGSVSRVWKAWQRVGVRCCHSASPRSIGCCREERWRSARCMRSLAAPTARSTGPRRPVGRRRCCLDARPSPVVRHAPGSFRALARPGRAVPRPGDLCRGWRRGGCPRLLRGRASSWRAGRGFCRTGAPIDDPLASTAACRRGLTTPLSRCSWNDCQEW